MQSDSLGNSFVQLLSIWSIRVSMLLFVVVFCAEALGYSRGGAKFRILWIVGAFAAMIHSVGALMGFHGGSHREAIQATADQTESVIGIPFGYGLFANYLFLAVWGWDALYSGVGVNRNLCRKPHRRTRRDAWILGFLAFIFFNGTVVFKDGWLRWTGIAATVLILSCYLFRKRFPMAKRTSEIEDFWAEGDLRESEPLGTVRLSEVPNKF